MLQLENKSGVLEKNLELHLRYQIITEVQGVEIFFILLHNMLSSWVREMLQNQLHTDKTGWGGV